MAKPRPPEVHPELARSVRWLPKITWRRWNLGLMRRLVARLTASSLAPGVEISETQYGAIRARVYRPRARTPRALFMWIHGGGLIAGEPKIDDGSLTRMAETLGIEIISPHYRLAPEHVFPSALDDAMAAWAWVQERASRLGIDGQRIALGGGSAGGGLAACLAQRLRDEGGAAPACQVLVYPMLDDRTAANPAIDPKAHFGWNNSSNSTGWSCYLGRPPGAPSLPDYAAAARLEDLSRLPPAWIGVGELDLFQAESLEYARRLEAAGVECSVEEVPGAYHGFDAIAPEASVSRAFRGSQHRFLRAHLTLDGP